MKGDNDIMKFKVFIGSSSESVDYAESVQLNIDKLDDIQAVCWHQGIFQPSHYPLEDLLYQLEKMSFGIFVLAPDDFIQIRGEQFTTVRDNVLFEMGMFFGALGKERTFFIAPQDKNKFRIPSDLEGLNYAKYTWESTGDDFDYRVGAACTQIKRMIKREIMNLPPKDSIEKYDLFSKFDGLYEDLFKSSKEVTTGFIHSRRWRESNLNSIEDFFNKKESHWDIILPDITDRELIKHIKSHFSDSSTMISKIIDAYMFCIENAESHPNKLKVYLYSYYPTYSFYRFDNKIVVSFYPLTSARRTPPTLLLDLENECNAFFEKDILDIKNKSKEVSIENLRELVDKYIIN